MNTKLSELLASDIAQLERLIAPSLRQIEVLRQALRIAKSREFVEEHRITRDQVVTTDDTGEWLWTIGKFAKWLAHNRPTKPWCEWNGTLHRTRDVIEDRMDWNSPGMIEHVPTSTIDTE